jgi:hypothetical protein
MRRSSRPVRGTSNRRADLEDLLARLAERLPAASRALSVSNQIVNDRPCVLTVLVDSHRDEIATRR